MNINELDPEVAKRIIEACATGVPPEYGLEYFTAGLDEILKVVENRYLKDYIPKGGSAFKLVIAAYGQGKTHFLYCVRNLAWKYNFLVCYISVSPNETPFHKIEEVYKSVINSLSYPITVEDFLKGRVRNKGIDALLKVLYYKLEQDLKKKYDAKVSIRNYVNRIIGTYESISFTNATRYAIISLFEKKIEDYNLILQWLKGENPDKRSLRKFNISEKVDRTTAPRLLRSLTLFAEDIGYSGLVLLIDELEPVSSLIRRSDRMKLLQNLRELVDGCASGAFNKTLIFYATPDERPIDDYPALKQRLQLEFDPVRNPLGARIYLEKLWKDSKKNLIEIGIKLARIYMRAYEVEFDMHDVENKLEELLQGGRITTKRDFIQKAIKIFNELAMSS